MRTLPESPRPAVTPVVSGFSRTSPEDSGSIVSTGVSFEKSGSASLVARFWNAAFFGEHADRALVRGVGRQPDLPPHRIVVVVERRKDASRP